MTVEQNRQHQRQREQNRISALIVDSTSKNQHQVCTEYQRFRRHYVHIDRPYEIPLLSRKDQLAVRTFRAHPEEAFVELANPTSRTLQLQSPNQVPPYALDLHI